MPYDRTEKIYVNYKQYCILISKNIAMSELLLEILQDLIVNCAKNYFIHIYQAFMPL